MNKINSKKGFTLVELLIVLAIIAVLTGVAMSSISISRKKSRDAKRVSDIKQLQTALQLYYDTNRTYPTTLNTAELVTAGYIKGLPKDPLTDNNYVYAALLVGTRCMNYHLGTSFEGIDPGTGILASDFDKTVTETACGGSNADFSGDDSAKCDASEAGLYCYDVRP